MELREWLIILGLALVTLIVVDGVRRLKRQRRVPRLDQVGDNRNLDGKGTDAIAESGDDTNWELPNGGARVVKPASYERVQGKPKLKRQEHPGPSRVLASLRAERAPVSPGRPEPGLSSASLSDDVAAPRSGETPLRPDAARREPAAPISSSSASDAGLSARAEEAETAAMSARDDVAEPAAPEPVKSRSAESRSVEPVVQMSSEPTGQTQRQDEEIADARAEASGSPEARAERREPTLSALDDDEAPAATAAEPLAADPEDHEELRDEDERYRLVDLEGMGDSLKSGSRRMGQSVQRFGVSMQRRLAKRRKQKREEKLRREKARAEKAALDAQRRREAEAEQAARDAERRRLEAQAIEQADDDDPLFAPPRPRHSASPTARDEAFDHSADSSFEPVSGSAAARPEDVGAAEEAALDDDVVRAHPSLAKALRHDVNAERARDTLSHADEVIVISVLSRQEEGFSGEALLDLMLACGLRYSREMGIFHRFETEDPESELQFSMVNVLKPGTFPIEAMDDFHTPGITLLMPLPGALDTAAAFEAMVETAMVIVRHLGGELKDENHSVMTAQTVEFARQRVQEFERRNRLNRYQVN
ncbi:cell division protein ZipA [Billgrantia endophytica]|uniref:Cell division protein ZipA n=1 Tax=Billgrantia endophytica TaxID=2033802 RepID=A0A2N7U6M2_9GAMM|nr:cell division protein ZipA [Halomonas endophytica]PMR76084.1 cell division protein ZipA [Halomonas endophytica]